MDILNNDLAEQLTESIASAKPTIDKVRYTHEALLQFLLANPTVSQGQLAKEFGFTQAWISIIINSDAFQYKLKQRQDEMFKDAVIITLRDKMVGTAHLALDKLGQKLEIAQDINDISDAADMLLRNMGYGNKTAPAPIIQNNVFIANRAALAESRRLLHLASSRSPQEVEVKSEVEDVETPERLQSSTGG